MFNPDTKEKFLQTIKAESTYKMARYTLESISKYEESANKDLIYFTHDEIDQMVTAEFGGTTASRMSRVGYMRMYFSWAKSVGLNDNMNSLKGISMGISADAIIDKYVYSPKHLNEYLDAVFDPVEKETADLILRGLFWLAFCGVPYKYAESMPKNKVDLEDCSINVNGVYYPLFAESIEVFKKLISLDSFRFFHPLYAAKVTWRERTDSEYLFRGLKRKDSKPKTDGARHHSISSDATKKLKAAVKKGIISDSITYETVRKSGMFYKMYLREQSGIEINFEVAVMRDIGEEKIKTMDKKQLAVYVKRKKRMLSNDYRAWKEALQIYENSLR